MNTRVTEKLKNIPEENIISPPINIAGPAVEALRFSGDDINLRELYATLLANSMDKDTVENVHPGFVEIIKSISSDEARLLNVFTHESENYLIDINIVTNKSTGEYRIHKKNHSNFHRIVTLGLPELIPSYLNNLCRLGILEIPSDAKGNDEKIYENLKKYFEQFKINIEKGGIESISFNEHIIALTDYGNQFVDSVVKNK